MNINYLIKDYRLSEGDKFSNKKKAHNTKVNKDSPVASTKSSSPRKIILHSSFEKTYSNRVIKGMSKQIKLDIITIKNALKDRKESSLPAIYKYHNLTGGGAACHIASGFVLLFMVYDDLVVFYDIGTHSQIIGYYGKNSKPLNLNNQRDTMYSSNIDKPESKDFFTPPQ